MRYSVHFVDDTALPEGVKWTIVTQGDRTYAFVRASAVDCKTGECVTLTRAWESWEARHTPPPQRRRIRTEIGYVRTAVAVLLAGYGVSVMKIGSAVI